MAQEFRDAEPRNLDADITEEAQSVTPPRAAAERRTISSRKKASVAERKTLAADLIEAIRIEVGSLVGTSQRTTERSPVRTQPMHLAWAILFYPRLGTRLFSTHRRSIS